MIQLIIYGVLALGAVFAVHTAWTGFVDRVSAPRVQAQIKSDQAKIDQADAAQKQAEQARDHALADSEACVANSQTQSDLVDLWQKRAADQAAASKAAKVAAAAQATAAQGRISVLQAEAAAPPKLMACQDELAKAKQTLRDALTARRTPTPPAAK